MTSFKRDEYLLLLLYHFQILSYTRWLVHFLHLAWRFLFVTIIYHISWKPPSYHYTQIHALLSPYSIRHGRLLDHLPYFILCRWQFQWDENIYIYIYYYIIASVHHLNILCSSSLDFDFRFYLWLWYYEKSQKLIRESWPTLSFEDVLGYFEVFGELANYVLD